MNEIWYDLIEDYHLGRLASPQLEQFEAALTTDEALAAAVREHRIQWEAQELLAEQVLRTRIREGLAQQSSTLPSWPNWWSKNWAWVLLALLFIGGFGYLLRPKTATPVPDKAVPQNAPPALPQDTPPPVQPIKKAPIAAQKTEPSPRQLAMAAYRVPDDLTNVRGLTDDSDTLVLANRAFSEKKYRLAVELLETLPAGARQEALVLRAHARLNTGQYAAAARDFADLEAGGLYRREAQWFGLLARMASPGPPRKEWMSQLDAIRQQAKHPYHAEAEALWEKY